MRSQSFLEPIHRASVFLMLSLRPDTLPKVSIKTKDSKQDSLEPSRMSVVSSAYWLNLNSLPFISIPLIFCFFRMASASTSTDRINRYGDKGQPCLTPRLSLKKLLAHPLFKVQRGPETEMLQGFIDERPLKCIKSFLKIKKKKKARNFFSFRKFNDTVQQTYILTYTSAFNKACLIVRNELWKKSFNSACNSF